MKNQYIICLQNQEKRQNVDHKDDDLISWTGVKEYMQGNEGKNTFTNKMAKIWYELLGNIAVCMKVGTQTLVMVVCYT